ncbi:hypothetical protein PIB30_034703 [Stylosanthes scabra]|uniref:Uncharacterized protein n=1 Tax=Stylosanthes scabra TaxID=79078 RepID=A0ABU6TCQ7_9FABA|nr:hypothetical protein [Stylosanthes scabra]
MRAEDNCERYELRCLGKPLHLKYQQKKLMMELVDCFNTNDNSMRTTLGRITLDASKIWHALGLNARGSTYEKKINNRKLSDERKTAVNSFKGASMVSLKRTVIERKPDSEENARKFKRAFILYIQKTFLCATNSTPLSPKHFLAIVNVDNSKQMNWARHVCSFLLDGITEMRWKNSKGVEGCVFALLIIYLHETYLGEDSEDDEARPPWLSYWRGDTLKERMKLEKKDSTNQIQREQSLKMTIDPPPQGVAAAIDGVLVTPPDSGIEVVHATSAEEELIRRETSESITNLVVETHVHKVDPPPQGVAAAIGGVLVTPPDSGIEVVQATSAEKELIRREMSESITNLVVETHVDKGVIVQKESVIEELTHRYWESNRNNGNENYSEETEGTRCSPSDVAKLLKKLSCEQKTVVRDMSFGVLKNFSILNISKITMMELVDCFNTNDNSTRTTLGRITLNASKIRHALGLKARGSTYEKKIDKKKLSDERKAAVNSFKGASIVSLKRTMIETKLDSEGNTRKFKRAFILYIQKTFLCATNSTPLSLKHFLAIVNVDNSKQMNWARHVCSFLLDGITEMRWRNSKGLKVVCLLCSSYICMRHTSERTPKMTKLDLHGCHIGEGIR